MRCRNAMFLAGALLALPTCKDKDAVGTTEITSLELPDGTFASEGDFTRTRDSYVAKVDRDLRRLDERLSAAESRVGALSPEDRAAVRAQIAAARNARELLRLDMRGLAYGRQASWREDRSALDAKLAEMTRNVERVEQRLEPGVTVRPEPPSRVGGQGMSKDMP